MAEVVVARVALVPYSSSVNVVDSSDELYSGTATGEEMATLAAAGVHVADYRPDVDTFTVIYNKPADERLTMVQFEAKFGAAAASLVSNANQDKVIAEALAVEAAAAAAIQKAIDDQAAIAAAAIAEQEQRNADELARQEAAAAFDAAQAAGGQ